VTFNGPTRPTEKEPFVMSVQPITPPKPKPQPLSWGPNDLPVPYAVAWSGEVSTVGGALTVRPDGSGLAYRDETPQDRDRNGMLWARIVHAPGTGRPDYRAMHIHRQRQAMLHKLCQVCGGPADRTSRGWLFLLADTNPAPARRADWLEGSVTTKPPICLPCAELAIRHCPHLTAPVFVRSRKPRAWGVFGGFFLPTATGTLTASDDTYLPYGAPPAPWFLASQAATELTRCTRITPNRLSEMLAP
jgi:hypothetical protein